MNQPINTFQDILDAMERDPALADALREHILTKELLQMPVRLTRIEQDIASLKEGQTRLERKVDVIGGKVSNLAGDGFENHVCVYAHRILRREMGAEATVLATQRDRASLVELMDKAEAASLVKPEETDFMNDTDLVLSAEDETRYYVAEISLTIQQKDIRRAAKEAEILEKATGRAVTALAIGAAEEPGLRKGTVRTLICEEPRNPA